MRTTKRRGLVLDRHERPPGLRLKLELEGTREPAIARGLQAAQAVFEQADVPRMPPPWPRHASRG